MAETAAQCKSALVDIDNLRFVGSAENQEENRRD
jgi:hypothetical protein